MSARREAQLARRAQRGGLRGTARPSCPPELRRCLVYEWLSASACDEVEESGWNSPLVVTAWRRWLNARQAYADEVGQPVMKACGPTARPSLERS